MTFTIQLLFVLCFKGITYLLVYRTDKYKKLTAEVEKDSKKCKLQYITNWQMSHTFLTDIFMLKRKLKKEKQKMYMSMYMYVVFLYLRII